MSTYMHVDIYIYTYIYKCVYTYMYYASRFIHQQIISIIIFYYIICVALIGIFTYLLIHCFVYLVTHSVAYPSCTLGQSHINTHKLQSQLGEQVGSVRLAPKTLHTAAQSLAPRRENTNPPRPPRAHRRLHPSLHLPRGHYLCSECSSQLICGFSKECLTFVFILFKLLSDVCYAT